MSVSLELHVVFMKPIVHRSTDYNLVRNVSPKVASNVVTTMFLLQMTNESHSKLCVVSSSLLAVVVIIALIGIFCWPPGNGKQWPIDLITTLCLDILLVLIYMGNSCS